MDIRDELDVMLDNLKSGSAQKPSAAKSASKTSEPKKTAAQRKNVFDEMSVDELVSAVTADKKPAEPVKPEQHKPTPKSVSDTRSIPQSLLFMLSTGKGAPPNVKKKGSAPIIEPRPETVSVSEQAEASLPKKKPEPAAEKTAVPKPSVSEKKVIEETSIPNSAVQRPETAPKPMIQESMPFQEPTVQRTVESPEPPEQRPTAFPVNEVQHPTPSTEKLEVVPESAVMTPETEKLAAKEPSKLPKKKKKKIIINHELPDYEAIRRKALEEAAAAEEEAANTAEEAAPEEISEPTSEDVSTAFEEASAQQEEIFSEAVGEIEKLASDAPEEETAPQTEEEADVDEPEKKQSKGLFGAIRSVFSNMKSDDDDFPELPSVDEVINESRRSEAERESDTVQDDAYTIEEELPENEQIADAAPEEALHEDDVEEPSEADIIGEALAAIEAVAPEEAMPEDNFESKLSDSIISDIRENAANAIADLDEPFTEEESAVSEPEVTETIEAPEDEEESAEEDDLSEETAELAADEVPENDTNIDISLGKPARKSRIVASLENILDEDPAELSNERSEKTEEDEIDVSLRSGSRGKAKKRIYGVLGVLFTLLAAVGLITVIKFGIARFTSFTSGETKKDGFIDVVYPVVIMDIESFNEPTELPSDQIITAAIWSIVMSADDMDKYDKTFDVISVPSVDVEAYAAKLFGDKLPVFEHTTVGEGDIKFYYNEETKRYNIPVNPISFTYEPKITSVSKNGNEYTIRVDYYKELPSWMEKSENFTKEISKTVEFRLTQKDDNYTISSMAIVNVNSAV